MSKQFSAPTPDLNDPDQAPDSNKLLTVIAGDNQINTHCTYQNGKYFDSGNNELHDVIGWKYQNGN